MGINLDKIRGRLNNLQNATQRTLDLWKPAPGKHQVRLVPYKFNEENPFIELYFHYNINNKTYLSPSSFGRPDPFVEFASTLKRSGDKEEWKMGKKLEPKLRTFVPVLVRGEENEGVRFWGFGKTVYQEILGYIADPDYGDITDPTSGRDIVVEVVSAEDSGTSYPVTTIRVKPNQTPLSDNDASMKNFLQNQKEITDLYQELSYDELKEVLKNSYSDDSSESVSTQELSSTTPKNTSEQTSGNVEEAPAAKVDDAAAAFDDLFNS